jgi:hypothetical protein
MAGWILTYGKGDLNNRLARFQSIFDVNRKTALLMRLYKLAPNFASVLWSWGDKSFSDLTIIENRKGFIMLLCGAPTGFGKFGEIPRYSNDAANLILELWRKHNTSFINELNGSWSLCIFDENRNRMYLYVDRFASRSIWLSFDINTWLVGNFPSAIAACRQSNTYFNPVGLYSLFYLSRHAPGLGLYNGIVSLMAGQQSCIKPEGKISILNWWQRRYVPDHKSKPQDIGYAIAHALRNSAKRIKRITDKSYLFLSGGLDSRITAAAYGEDITALTLYSKVNPELQYARMISMFLGINHTTMRLSPDWFIDSIVPTALVGSGNFHIRHAHFIVPIIHTKLQEGNGSFLLGDLLENLNKHYYSCEKNSIKSIFEMLGKRIHEIDAYTFKQPEELQQIFQKDIRHKINAMWHDYIGQLKKHLNTVSDDIADRLDTYFRWIDVSVTPTYIMISSIWPFASERNIALDNDIDYLSRSIPSEIRKRKIIHKWVLWHLSKQVVCIPNAIDNLPVFMPQYLHNYSSRVRAKLGNRWRKFAATKYPTALSPTTGCWPLWSELFRKNNHYIDAVESILGDRFALPDNIFNRKYLNDKWREFVKGNNDLLFIVNGVVSFGYLNKLFRFDDVAF